MLIIIRMKENTVYFLAFAFIAFEKKVVFIHNNKKKHATFLKLPNSFDPFFVICCEGQVCIRGTQLGFFADTVVTEVIESLLDTL